MYKYTRQTFAERLDLVVIAAAEQIDLSNLLSSLSTDDRAQL